MNKKNETKRAKFNGLSLLKWELILVALLPGALVFLAGLWILGFLANLNLGNVGRGLLTFLGIVEKIRKKKAQDQAQETTKSKTG